MTGRAESVCQAVTRAAANLTGHFRREGVVEPAPTVAAQAARVACAALAALGTKICIRE